MKYSSISTRKETGGILSHPHAMNEQQQYEGLHPSQLEQLTQPLDMRLIRHRKGGGKMLAYITGKTAEDNANRIFGFGGWGTKVVARSRESCTDPKKGIVVEFYTCDIELYVLGAAFPFAGDGVGIVNDPYTIEMHEKARKDAYTDALKRALRHFGDQFGLCLYDENALVLGDGGKLVQVKAVPINDGKQQPPRPEGTGKPQESSAPRQQSPLTEEIKRAKLRAQKMGVARDAVQWATLLKVCKVVQIKSAVDLAKVNGHMTAIEKGVVVTVESKS